MKYPLRKKIAWVLLVVTLKTALFPPVAYALSEGPVQPEAMQFEPANTTDMVNLATGDLAYNLPLFNIPGVKGGFPLNLSYHSGIGSNQEANWVGLGWSLNPGAINRSVAGFPDDYENALIHSEVDGRSDEYGVSIGVGYGPSGLNVAYNSNSGFSVNAHVGYELVEGVDGEGGVNASFKIGYDQKKGFSGGASIEGSVPKLGKVGLNASDEGFKVQMGPVTSGTDGLHIATPLGIIGADANGELAYDPTGLDKTYDKIFGKKKDKKEDERTLEEKKKDKEQEKNKQYPDPKPKPVFNGTPFGGKPVTIGYQQTHGGGSVTFGQQMDFGVKAGFGKGTTTAYAISISPFQWLTLGFSYTRWRLRQAYDDRAFGHFRQGEFLDRFPNVQPGPAVPSIAVYDRDVRGRFVYPAQDAFSVSAPNISGTFQGFIIQPYLLCEDNCRDANFKPMHPTVRKGVDASGPGSYYYANPFPVNKYPGYEGTSVVYRYLDDPGANFASFEQSVNRWGQPSDNMIPGTDRGHGERFNNRHVGKRIEALAGYSNQKEHGKPTTGFSITDNNGKTYIFQKPVYNWCRYTQTRKKIEGGYINNDVQTAKPYAETWMITAIQGSDYVDQNKNQKTDLGDTGYWVAFEYASLPQPAIWRSPFTDYSVDFVEVSDVKSYGSGLREQVYLKQITTPTHRAVFESSVRKDRKMAAKDPNLVIAGQPVGQVSTNYIDFRDIGDDAMPGKSWVIPGDWTAPILAASATTPILSLSHPNAPDMTWTYTKGELASVSFLPPTQPGTLGYTMMKVNAHIATTIQYQRAAHVPLFLVGNISLSNAPLSGALKLDRIALYAHGQTTIAKAVEFTYDYSLCPGTPNSLALATDGAAGGKLCLKSVQMVGRGGNKATASLPPYRFQYGNGAAPGTGLNPAFDKNDYTVWGSYRDPLNGTNRGDGFHDTPQTASRANLAAAWSLTKVTLPLSGEISFEYESDDFMGVTDMIDMQKVRIPAELSTQRVPFKFPNAPANQTLPALGHWATFQKIDNSTTFKCKASLVTSLKLREDLPLVFVARKLLKFGQGTPPEYKFRHKVQLSRIKTIAMASDSATITLQKGLSLANQPLQGFFHDVGFITPPPRVYGDQLRVKKVSYFDGFTTQANRYIYETPDGRSSGVTATIPPENNQNAIKNYGMFPDLFASVAYTNNTVVKFSPEIGTMAGIMDFGERTQYSQLFPGDSLSYNRPGPGIVYSEVALIPQDANGQDVSGKTVYKFGTARDCAYTVTNDNPNELLSIQDLTSGIGQLRSVTYHEYVYSAHTLFIHRPVTEIVYDYALGSELKNRGKVLYYSKVANMSHELATNSPIGSVRYKYAFRWQAKRRIDPEETVNSYRRRVDYFHDLSYKVGTTTKQFYYGPTQGASPEVMQTSNVAYKWDGISGREIATYQSAYPDAFAVEVFPAYWTYAGMEQQNMLNPNFTTANVNCGTRRDYDMRTIPPGVSEWKSCVVQTYAPDLSDAKGREIWLPNDTYQYDNVTDYLNGSPWNFFDQEVYKGTAYPKVTPAFPWQMVQNTTRYDAWSNPIEEIGVDGKYKSALYGYSGQVMTALADNAKASQIAFFDFDECAPYNCTLTGRTGKALQASLPINAWTATLPLAPGDYTMTYFVSRGIAPTTVKLTVQVQTGATNRKFSTDFATLPATGWQPVKQAFTIAATGGETKISIYLEPTTLNTIWHGLDDLRIAPKDALLSTYSYDPISHKVTAITDPSNRSILYEYDLLDRLKMVRDNDNNIVARQTYGTNN